MTTPKARAKLEKFRVLLDWTPNTNHTGLFWAREKGYYKDAGLDVEIVSADGASTLDMLATGSAEVGISFQEQLTAARCSDTPLPVVAIGAILQKNTSGFVSMADKNIKTVKDLEGKTYGSWGTDIEDAFIKSLMEKNGADFNTVDVKVTNALDSLTLIKTEADFAWIYYGWDGVAAKVNGEDIDFMLLQDYDPEINFYSPLLATSEDVINAKSDQLKRFMEATSKGYEEVAKNPEEAAKMMFSLYPDVSEALWTESQKYLSDYLLDENGKFGTMADSVWQNFTAWMQKNQIISAMPEVSAMYTNEFLPN